MKKLKGCRILSVILVLAMAVGALSGCGLFGGRKSTSLAELDTNTIFTQIDSPLSALLKSAESASAADTSAESASEEELSDDMGGERFNFTSAQAANGKYYVLYTDLESAGNVYLCSFDEKGKGGRTIPISSSEDGGITTFCVMPDDSLILVENRYVEEKETFVHQMGRYTVEGGDKPALKEVWKKTISEEEDFYPTGAAATEKEIFLMTESGVIIYDSKDGAEKLKAELPKDFFGNICKTPDGRVLLAGSGSNGASSFAIDPATGKYEETKYETDSTFFAEAYSSGCGEYDFYMSDTSGVYGFK